MCKLNITSETERRVQSELQYGSENKILVLNDQGGGGHGHI